ncbi:CpaF family protein [Marinobacterium rhizophilum]|uniref:CpaF family protein n=1 Tax=Marinobacterium rhizophilum TaxID=420402 RepID=A0ABY5HKC6_9GAMM|nr:CpaF family protein [Marinobacterium rhizophilum]UTW12048.1 CpaF family protein [Marinobacterium rhizophilum]
MNVMNRAVQSGTNEDYFRRIRRLLHRRLIDSVEEEGNALPDSSDAIRKRVAGLLDEFQYESGVSIDASQGQQIAHEIIQELGGMGPLAPLMLDSELSDILVNGPDEVWVDRQGRLELTPVRFDDEAHLRRFVDRLVSAQGRHLDAGSPMVDARLSDGSRLHAVIPPLCGRGTVVSIRRFRVETTTRDELLQQGFISEPMLELLSLAVRGGLNIVIAGGAAAGKTTLLNLLSRFIPQNERVVTVEETAELQLEHGHVISLEAKPGNLEGSGGIGLRELVRTALRMRADRIIVGEVRGCEVFDMLQAMNVGHDGSLTTVHANSPGDVLRRLEALALMGDTGLPRESVRDMIGSAIQVVVQLVRFRDGSRRVASVSEVISEEGQLSVRELYRFKPDVVPQAPDEEHAFTAGQHQATGAPVSFLARLQLRGFDTSSFIRSAAEAGDAGTQVPHD